MVDDGVHKAIGFKEIKQKHILNSLNEYERSSFVESSFDFMSGIIIV